MQPSPPLGAWLRAAAVAAAIDVAASVTAWATWRDRAALLGLLISTTLATALAAWLWSCATAALVPQPRLRRLVFAAPFALALGALVAETATLRRWLGAAATPLALWAACCAAALFARAWRGGTAPSTDLGGEARAARRSGAIIGWLMIGAGTALLAAPLLLPRRLYPSLRMAALMAGMMVLVHGFARRARQGSVRRALIGVVACGAAALLLSSVSANVRFVARDRPPATGVVLAAIDALVRVPEPSGLRAAAAQVAEASGGLGDAHFLLISIDALRADRALPETFARAHGALRWTHAYAQAPHTAFSVTSLLTGAAPDLLSQKPPTAAEMLKARRWFTQAWYPAGLFFDGRRALEPYAASRFGFAWADTRTLDAQALTDSVLERIASLRRDGEPRAFLWAHYFDPHEPYEPHQGTRADDTPERRYDGEIAHVDRALARLLDGLAELERPVLVAITGDHGEEFGEHGGAYHGSSLYDEQLRVPLVMFLAGGRGRTLPAATLDAPSEIAALLPTALGMLDVRDAPPLRSRRLWPEPEQGADVHAQVHSRRMLLRGRYKLIRETRGSIDELYDLQIDPSERHNLADALPAVRAELSLALGQWFGLERPETIARTIADPRALPSLRAAAARELGEQEATSAAPVLRAALADAQPEVAAEAALALGALSDSSAAPALVSLLDAPLYRKRAGLMLGRLRDPRGAAALRDTLLDIDVGKRRHACHYLGFVGASDAIPQLIARTLEDQRIRNDAYLALGRIAARTGDPSAVRFLIDRLTTEDLDDARAHAIWALGLAGPHRVGRLADPRLLALATADPPSPLATEALIRLGAIPAGAIGGTDISPGLVANGLDACARREEQERFDAATTCALCAPELHLTVPAPRWAPHPRVLAPPPEPPTGLVGGPAPRSSSARRLHPPADVAGGARRAWVVLRARALRDGPLRLRVVVDGALAGEVALGAGFAEKRMGPVVVSGARASVTVTAIDPPGGTGALAELDHLLLLPAP